MPHEQPRPSEREPHRHRQVAESFGTDPERYDRTRPAYPDALVERIVAASPGPDVLDVGCGTGTEARQFQAAGGTVVGIEPDARMAELARRRGLEVEVATLEAWDPAGRRFDAVVAGTAWHWVDPVEGAARRPRCCGPVACWRRSGTCSSLRPRWRRPWPRSTGEWRPTRRSTSSRRGRPWTPTRRCSPRPPTGSERWAASATPEQWRYDWKQSYTRDEWLDQLPTSGALTQLPPDKLAEVLAAVGAAIDAIGGGFTMPSTTVAVAAARTDSPRPFEDGSWT